ncbi:hypothetical protein D918_01644 [Trichuris suis]|nr:hypothetical protein D918_01644 [Trichuris suis]
MEQRLMLTNLMKTLKEEKYNKDILIFIDVSMTHTCKPGSRTLAYASVCGINKSREDRGLIQRTKSWKVNNVNHVEKKSNVIASRNVQRFVRSYFNCSDAEGAELENDGGFGTAGSHWEKRLFGYFSGMNAVLEDMTVIHGASVTGADKYTDHCPMWQDVFHGDKSSDVGDMVCDNSGNRPDSKRNIGLEIYGHDSICVEQEGIFVAMECLPPRIFNLVQTRFDTMYGAGCYQYKCENGRLWIRGAGNSDDVGTMQYKVCWAEGAKIRLIRYLKDGDGSPTALYRGTLICPSCKEICEKNGFICEPDMQGINARDYMPSPCGGCRHLSVKWLIPAYVVGNLLLKLFH